MTVFEQTIDTSQVQMELSFFRLILIASIWIVLVIFCTLHSEKKMSDARVDPAISILASVLIFVIGTALMFFVVFYLPPIKALSQPVYGEPRDYGVRNSSEKSIADTYRDEIDKSIKDKLGDYEIPEYSIDNPQKSILGGGYLEKKIAAVRDGKTYTLAPEWSYDRDASKVTLSVDIEEGYHIEK